MDYDTINVIENNKEKFLMKYIKLCLKFILVFSISYIFIRYANRNVELLALHLDDMTNYMSYLELGNLKAWIIDFYPNRMHYRPIFYIILINIFRIISGHIERLLIVNIVINSMIATVIYFLMDRLHIKILFKILTIVLYSVISYSYFQIYEAIGCIEGIPLMLSLIILVSCIKNRYYDEKKYTISCTISLILYILMVFTHERYFPMLLLILISISTNANISKRTKNKFFVISFVELFAFFAIRYYHLRIIIPRGTDCSSLVENFDLIRSFKFIYHQIMYLLGVNLGPRYLCGMNFYEASNKAKFIIAISAMLILILFVVYIVGQGLRKKYKRDDAKNSFTIDNVSDAYNKYVDRYFIIYIFLCILQSSLTIRVEMRWLYASFMALVMYMSYIVSKAYNVEISENAKINLLYKYSLVSLFLAFFIGRMLVNSYYKRFDELIFIINEQKVVNNLYKNTVGKYGIDKIRNMNVYITSDNYKIISSYERWYFFDQYDGKISDREMIKIESDSDKIIDAINDENSIVLEEDNRLGYRELVDNYKNEKS